GVLRRGGARSAVPVGERQGRRRPRRGRGGDGGVGEDLLRSLSYDPSPAAEPGPAPFGVPGKPLLASAAAPAVLAARPGGRAAPREQIDFAERQLAEDPEQPLPGPGMSGARAALRDRLFYSPRPLGPEGQLALVFPGSGNHFPGMGRDLAVHWPAVLRRQQAG